MPINIFTPSVALGTNDGNTVISFRNSVVVTAGSNGQVRATFSSGTATAQTAANCSIGVHSGVDGWATASTPVELLFGGGSGFTIPSNSQITSDFVSLNFAITDRLVVTIDLTGTGSQLFSTGETNCDCWFLASGATYNQADPAGMTPLATKDYMVVSVETNDPAAIGGPVGMGCT